MDIGHMTDLLPYAFTVASNLAYTFPHQAAEASADIWTAVHEPGAMPDAARNFQIIKIAGSSLGLAISAPGASIEGVTAFAIADCEALMELEKAGHQWRVTHQGPPPKPDW